MTPLPGTPPGFVSGPVSVRAPATSANLGPGFDSFALALSWHDTVTATVAAGGLEIEVDGEGAGELPLDETHLVVRAVRATFDVLGVAQPGLRLSCRNTVPQGRGLGTSAAAIVAGIRLAEELALDTSLRPGQDLELAAALEGHADNVAGCLLGGFTIAWTDAHDPTSSAGTGYPAPTGARTRAVRLDVHPDIQLVLFVPPTGLSTAVARSLLPAEVPHADACLNAGRGGLLAAALTTHPEHLLAATEDRLHQGFRRVAMPETLNLLDRLRSAGHAAVVSGAGPAVLVLATPEQPLESAGWPPRGWRQVDVPVDRRGARGVDHAAGLGE